MKRIKITITGRVQGVGFRPCVYRLAKEYSLTGFVKNTPSGVDIEAQGKKNKLEDFIHDLKNSPPRRSNIESFLQKEIPLSDSECFSIRKSSNSGDLISGMPPDIAICEDCLRELFEPSDRRFEYPFINCTNCGPRFTIISSLPYDRDKTSMSEFKMCNDCLREYNNPDDRRFDAQPDACSVCGPQISLLNNRGKIIKSDDPVSETVARLKKGEIAAVKGLGGYHLCCDARNSDAAAELRKRKRRPRKAFAVMFSSVEEISKYCKISGKDKNVILSCAAPIVIIEKKHDGKHLSPLISPDSNDLGVFLPYTPLHAVILSKTGPLIMTSGNISDEPIVKSENELSKINGIISDFALTHDRRIIRRCDDSVINCISERQIPLRISRGYVPDRIRLPIKSNPVLACGGDLKNSFCITKNGNAYMSQYTGDLNDYKAFMFYKESVKDISELLCVKFSAVACDMHPDYSSVSFAEQSGLNVIRIQHHHAHIASCMAEHGLTGKVIGVALDGTGYGTDGTFWGGEFLVADQFEFRHAGRFKQYPLPGGDGAVMNPYRFAYSCLISEFGHKSPLLSVPVIRNIPDKERQVLLKMITGNIRSPLTSSCGRLFDCVSALLGLCEKASYEGQAAVKLQNSVIKGNKRKYKFTIKEAGSEPAEISFGNMLGSIAEDIIGGVDIGEIAFAFHDTVANAVSEMCVRLREKYNLDRAVLSGGVFQNPLLLDLVCFKLEKTGFRVYSHVNVPPNDGGIALGQAYIASALLNRGNT